MDILVFSVILSAGALHSLWNTLLKGSTDKQVAIVAVVLGHIPLALLFLTFSPNPHPSSWPYILIGATIHVAYQLLLSRSYQIGDLSQMYPLIRGAAPLFIGIFSFFFLDIDLAFTGIIAILIIGFGIVSMTFTGKKGQKKYSLEIIIFSLLTGLSIAGYSMVDGIGAYYAGTAFGFYAWLSIFNAIFLLGFMSLSQPQLLKRFPREGKRAFLFGGTASFGAYGLVVWAYSKAPIVLVASLRETSIIFALLLGRFYLKERLGRSQIIAAGLIATGAILVRLA